MNGGRGTAVTHAHRTQLPAEGPDEGSFAERLDFLCKNDPRGPFSNPTVVRMLDAQGLHSFSSTYMWQLRSGRADNPTKNTMDGLADFFGVPKDYWSNRATAQIINRLIARLNGFKANGATPEQLHRQLVSFTRRMSEGAAPEVLIAQLDELARMNEQGVTASTLKRLQDARVTSIAMRAAGLSDQGLSAAAAMIEQVRRLEGLPIEPTDQPDTGREHT
ncbi:XRE family transcriptional regulator [Streptomyces noursei]|nr:XRE family transcriptional regulator [Streptomyces noursei]